MICNLYRLTQHDAREDFKVLASLIETFPRVSKLPYFSLAIAAKKKVAKCIGSIIEINIVIVVYPDDGWAEIDYILSQNGQEVLYDKAYMMDYEEFLKKLLWNYRNEHSKLLPNGANSTRGITDVLDHTSPQIPKYWTISKKCWTKRLQRSSSMNEIQF
jgi:hypothetical protein